MVTFKWDDKRAIAMLYYVIIGTLQAILDEAYQK